MTKKINEFKENHVILTVKEFNYINDIFQTIKTRIDNINSKIDNIAGDIQ